MALNRKFITWILPVVFTLAPAFSGDKSEVIHVAGVQDQVEIVRDQYGVPHIYAKSEADAIFGLGYVHAQDRFWQMEYQRRVGNGRLAEILGSPALPADKLFRTVGLRRAAVKAWANSDATQRQVIGAYAAGVNAYLTSGPLPLEFELLGYTPEPWQPEDTLVSGNLVLWALDGNFSHELLRSQIAQKLGVEKAGQLTPAYTKDGPVIVPASPLRTRGASAASPSDEHPDLRELLALNTQAGKLLGVGGQGLGSNNWVLSGARTTSGKPMLAGDPHVGTQTPALFYVAHLSAPGLDVFGATLPGNAGVTVGHNDRIAWALSTANVDVQDLYLEHINGQNEAEFKGTWEPLEIVPETIRVKGGFDFHLRVRISRHGPLISDAVAPNGPPVALRWTALELGESLSIAFVAANRARNRLEFLAAFRTHRRPGQNVVYADVDGNIGYLLAADVPIRAKGDGSMPVPGWTGEYEWTGYVPFAQLPELLNPKEGFIATANNKVIVDDYPFTIGTNFAAPYRAARILEMIQAKSKHSAEDMAVMQADVLAVHARELLPLLLATKPGSEREKQAIELLKNWDLQVTARSAGAAVFEAWYVALGRRLFADELGEALWETYSANIYMIGMALPDALHTNTAWCDDVRTPLAESCGDTIAAALNDGIARMTKVQGSLDISKWNWGTAHLAFFPHSPFDKNDQLKSLFSRKISHSGDKHTVNVGSAFDWDTYSQLHAAVYRQIIDFSDAGKSRFIVTPGQSGDPHSPHYDDLLPRWQRGEYAPILHDRADIEGGAIDQFVLVP
jgi:penicillin amidase